MKTFSLVIAGAMLSAVVGALAGPTPALAADTHTADAAPNWRTGLTRTDLARQSVSAAGYELIQSRVDFAPGITSPRHSHPGEEVAFVIEGAIEYQLTGRPAVVLKAGSSLVIPAGTPHVARNVGDGKASELATYIVRKDLPLVKIEE